MSNEEERVKRVKKTKGRKERRNYSRNEVGERLMGVRGGLGWGWEVERGGESGREDGRRDASEWK